MGVFSKLLQDTFAYQPQNVEPPAPVVPEPMPEPVPEKKTYNTRDSVTRDVTPEVATAVQNIIWGGAGAPVPGNAPAPTGGLAAGMGQNKGWGKTSG